MADESVNDNSTDESSFELLLQQARDGQTSAIGRLLQEHRNYLLLIANQDLDPKVRGKVGSSDVVQESLISAHRNFNQFRGRSREQLVAWLRQIVRNDLIKASNTFRGTRKRQIDREKSLQNGSALQHPLVDPAMTPATNALAAEEAIRLNRALNQLPDDYQQVLRLRSWDQLSFEDAGEAMSRSADAARKLWTRAIVRLQEVLENPDLEM